MRIAGVVVALGLIGCGEIPSEFSDAGSPPDAELVACAGPDDCPSGICDGVCVNVQQVPCADVAPANASSNVIDVEITFDEDTGWSEPAACAWSCDATYCLDEGGAACNVDLGIDGYDPGPVGSRWFGGDDRDLDGNGSPDIRSVGDGQSFVLLDGFDISHVGMYFTSQFGSAASGGGFDTTVRFILYRISGGATIGTADVVVPASFTEGWVYAPISASLNGDTSYLLTAHVPGVFSGQNYSSGVRIAFVDGFNRGQSYAAEIREPADLGIFSFWSGSPDADVAFRLVIDDGCAPPP